VRINRRKRKERKTKEKKRKEKKRNILPEEIRTETTSP